VRHAHADLDQATVCHPDPDSHEHPDPDADADGYQHRHADPELDPDADTNLVPEPDRVSFSGPVADPDSHPDQHPDREPDRDADLLADPNRIGDIYENGHRYRYAVGDLDSIEDANRDHGGKPHAEPHRYGNSVRWSPRWVLLGAPGHGRSFGL
jgi:hypothetical protein